MDHLSITDTTSLLGEIKKGYQPTFMFFWGHEGKAGQPVGRECLSQWYSSPLRLGEQVYPTAEHYMMCEKARLFHDDETLQKMLLAVHPREVKQLGREVKGFDNAIWDGKRVGIIIDGNLAKFRQNPGLSDFLLQTGDLVLVEASPRDTVWGIGLDEQHPDAVRPENWLGLNLLGFALMRVRSALRSE